MTVCRGNAYARESPYVFRHIDITAGLSDNYVKGVFPLPDGRIGIRSTLLLSLFGGVGYADFPFTFREEYPIAYNHMIPDQYVDSEQRVWMKERGVLRVFDLTTEQYVVDVDSLLLQFGLKEKVKDMFADSEGRCWFLTDESSSTYRYDGKEKTLELICPHDEFMEYYGRLLGVESRGDYSWMAHQRGVICCYDQRKKRFVKELDFLKDQLRPDDRVVMKILDNGDFWVMWDRGIGYYNVYNDQWNPISDIRLGHYSWFTSMDVDKGGNAWVGTVYDGVYTVDMHNFSVNHLPELPLLSGKTVQSGIQSIYCNREDGSVWIGLYNQGICYYHPSMSRFTIYDKKLLAGDWKGEEIRCIYETSEGMILMGTADGLYRYYPESHRMEIFCKELVRKNCRMLYEDSKKRIWAGTYHDGLYCIENGRVRRYDYPDTDYQNELDYSNIRTMVEDGTGQLWISIYGGGGVGRFNPENGEITLLSERFPELKKYKVANTLAVDNHARLVVGSDNGMYIYHPATDSLWIPERDGDANSVFNRGSYKYNWILKDHEGTLWFATQYGLKVLTPDNKSYMLGKEHGLAGSILRVKEDCNHDIWVSTFTSIHRITVDRNPAGYGFHTVSYVSDTEMRKGDLFSFPLLATRNQQLYCGMMYGFMTFSIADMLDHPAPVRPLITSFRLFNTQVGVGEEYHGRVLLDKALGYSDGVSLAYDENFVTLEFSGLNFSSPSQTSFRYLLEGFDKEWTENGQGRVTYSNLSPGDYVFRVSAAGNDRVWGPEIRFAITVRPPFWDTLLARTLYVVLGCLAVAGAVYAMGQRNHRKMMRMQEEEALKQKEELDQMKFRFFTNISHELRTPLTLIITPLDTMIRKLTDETLKKQLNTVYKNAQNLLALVNQLLDFRKLEMKGERLHLMNGDMEEFIVSAYQNFMQIAVEKRIDFVDATEHRPVYLFFDRDKVHKIVNNLLSNAFKYTPEGGTVTLQLTTEETEGRSYVKISVSDTGIGIPASDLPYVFDRFYQVGNEGDEKMGSGIGLHLVREYVNLHGGKIAVDSRLDCGSVFTVWLPMDLNPEPSEEEGADSAAEPETLETKEVATASTVTDEHAKTLLLVEDNREFRTFLKEQLADFYRIVEAADGEEGERKAIEENPDLIVSDIMMPKVDGIELCRRIKTNVQTSHIPVILLTARTADDIKINSYEVGADSYMSKPFNFDMLMVRIEKLIEQQEKRKQEFRQNIEVNPSAITITSVDEQLIQRCLEYIEKNMDNPEYGVEELSRDLGMVRMSLYRKLQSITGNTPTDFIRSIRLKRAAQLLQGSRLPIVEVANRVGFGSPSYFSKCFKEMFGMLPKQYVEKYEKK